MIQNKYERVYGRWRDPPLQASLSRSELKGRHWCRRLGFLVHLIGTQKKRSKGEQQKSPFIPFRTDPPPLPSHPPGRCRYTTSVSPLRQRTGWGSDLCRLADVPHRKRVCSRGWGVESINGMKLMEFLYYLNQNLICKGLDAVS
jgi:hypothetical protein